MASIKDKMRETIKMDWSCEKNISRGACEESGWNENKYLIKEVEEDKIKA